MFHIFNRAALGWLSLKWRFEWGLLALVMIKPILIYFFVHPGNFRKTLLCSDDAVLP